MNPIDYKEFKNWLKEKYNGEYYPAAVDYLYSFNKYMLKYKGETYFDIIKGRKFAIIYEIRHCYRYLKNKERIPIRNKMMQIHFEYCEIPYDDYIRYEAETSLQNLRDKRYLFIHNGNIGCLRYKHPIEDIAAQLTVGSTEPIVIHATHCKKCGISFISKDNYLKLRKQYPYIVTRFCEISEDGYSLVCNSASMAAESPLKLCGYSVGKNSLSTAERHNLLADIVYNGILTRTEIEDYLTHFIGFNGQKDSMWYAQNKWEDDLSFIRTLDLEKLRPVSFTDIIPYASRFTVIDKTKIKEVCLDKEMLELRPIPIDPVGLDAVENNCRIWATIKENKKTTILIVDVEKRPVQTRILGKKIGDEVNLGIPNITYVINHIERLETSEPK